LRQLAVLERLAARVEASPSLEAPLLLGSLAVGDGDELSDVDATPSSGVRLATRSGLS
jgi:hypothetical protein